MRRKRDPRIQHTRPQNNTKSVVFVLVFAVGVPAALAFALFQENTRKAITEAVLPETDLPLSGPEFDQLVDLFSERLYKRAVYRLGHVPEDKSTRDYIRNSARGQAVHFATFYVKAWNYGRHKGATKLLIERITFRHPNLHDPETSDALVQFEVDVVINKLKFDSEYAGW